MAYTVGLYTLGCKVSQYETEAIGEAFEALGFEVRDAREACDVYVVNTCTVTREADRKSRQYIRRLLKKNPAACVMVTGCYSQTTPHELAEIDGVAYISGTYGKMQLPQRALELLASPPATPVVEVTDADEAPFEPMCITRSPRTRAYVKVEDGCECRCTYCTIPAARGRVRSKAPADIFREVEGLTARGTQEVVLTGIETASYGVDLEGYRLIDLLEELDAKGYCKRLRLGSLTPEVVTEEFAARLGRLASCVPHFHLSVQSGCDRVLARMKRRYNAAGALAAMERLRRHLPGVQFTTDLMVGFPGETEEMFLETLDFVRRARFLSMHVFCYSRRAGTPADTYPDQVPEEVKHQRSQRLMELGCSIRDALLDEAVQNGKPLRLLLETKEKDGWHGHTDEFMSVTLEGDTDGAQGDLVWVMPRRHRDGQLYATLAHQA